MKKLIQKVMNSLSSKGLIFCSEADFQFSFAQELINIEHNAKIFLEKCVTMPIAPYYVDLIYYLNDLFYYVEFKYQTSQCTTKCGSFDISIKDQMAEDIMRYDYLHDIERLKNIAGQHKETFGGGCAIILTNDSLIYSEPAKYSTKVLDFNFRLHERTAKKKYPVPGKVNWNNASKGSAHWTVTGPRKGGFSIPPISTQWQEYLQFIDQNNVNQDFRYLVNFITIESK